MLLLFAVMVLLQWEVRVAACEEDVKNQTRRDSLFFSEEHIFLVTIRLFARQKAHLLLEEVKRTERQLRSHPWEGCETQ